MDVLGVRRGESPLQATSLTECSQTDMSANHPSLLISKCVPACKTFDANLPEKGG
jgi:hypothetical protein